ncbi:hypothetical protein [Brevundimonas sp. SL130]|uniref:hypothetical protein n=1 Tax=Brevundimonas sp. SL130 TaxID=2995143 RepID=UPI00226CAF84|nr:hypothetical protein [Brevundimonas sp. SL130]WAC60918.1 hypothetical protein OU998_05600 [Brevundimonas sp. SL130]
MSPDDFDLDLPQDLQDGLIAVGEAARDLDQPWWIFGGAAMALYGLTDLHVPDIDVLCAPRDARALLAALDGQIVPDPGEGLFRSAVFGRAPDQPVLVEVMADLEARDGAEWRPVAFTSRHAVFIDDVPLFVPDIRDHIALYRLFGRPKDLARIEQLERLIA